MFGSPMRLFSCALRRVFDVGSGSVKCMVAEVDLERKKLTREVYKSTSQVLLLPGINKSGHIINDAKMQLVDTMNRFLKETEQMHVKESYAIATQAFRQATNGKQVAEYLSTHTHIPMRIASVEEEARFAFLTALSLSSHNQVPENLVVWDCGAASFQLASLVASHADTHGSGTAHQLALSLSSTKNDDALSIADVENLIELQTQQLLPFPSWLVASSSSREVIAIGSSQSIFNQQRILSGLSVFTQKDVYSTILSLVGRNVKELLMKEEEGCEQLARTLSTFEYNVKEENAEYILPKLILLLCVMRKANIFQVRFVETTGNCAALLVHEPLWQNGSRSSLSSASALPSKSSLSSHLSAPRLSFSTAPGLSVSNRKSFIIPAVSTQPLLTVNWHLEKKCNYKCKFCYAHFTKTPANLSREAGFELLSALKDFGVFKVNFAGGEPLLNMHLGEYIQYAKTIGLRTSMITNASLLKLSWLEKYGEFIDQIGISCDSLNDKVNQEIGRGFGWHVPTTARALERINKLNRDGHTKIQVKLNTVVMRNTFEENWSEFILKHGVQRWKILKILRIEGENDQFYDDLSITDEQFQEFVDRHADLEAKGVTMAPEDNDDMTGSYLMVSPEGKFFQNVNGIYQYSSAILTHGVANCLNEIDFDYSKFQRRGGEYML